MIPYGRQSINSQDIEAITGVLKSDWLTTGPMVLEFEKNLSSFVGAECVTVSSGTAALHAAYSAIGIKNGDEVITPPLTFIATQATAVMCGATIKFADVLPDTGCIDPRSVLNQISKKTKAIVAVDFAGHPAELDELKSISRDRGIYLIEDAAHSMGSTYRKKNVGTIADLTTFSFFPTKNITTGEGGAVSSPNGDLLKAA
jgi:dTDP-4-amino-4,6-dideoxygalactose transaminase